MINDDKEKEYPDNINPNANSSGLLAIERAKLAMTLSNEENPESKELREALINEDDLLLEEKLFISNAKNTEN